MTEQRARQIFTEKLPKQFAGLLNKNNLRSEALFGNMSCPVLIRQMGAAGQRDWFQPGQG